MLRPLDLTTALRPSLLSDEALLFVQDAVGLYGGKAKLAEYQNGQAYLTSFRICYVDNERPRDRAIAIDLRDVEHTELYAGFLKSSAKITLIPKAAKFGPLGINGQTQSGPSSPRIGSPHPPGLSASQIPSLKDATWVCPICSFSNPVPPNFDPSLAGSTTPIPPCQACGIKPPLAHVVKAAITNISNQQRPHRHGPSIDGASQSPAIHRDDLDIGTKCPRCTFQNHPSLSVCEMCGTLLAFQQGPTVNQLSGSPSRSSSPAVFNNHGIPSFEPHEEVKLAFRAGGEKTFLERLRNALKQRKWLSQGAPPVPKLENLSYGADASDKRQGRVGIAGLERRGLEMRQNNEFVIGNAFEDLAALMASAKEIINLAESLASSNQPNDTGSEVPTSSHTADPNVLLAQLNLTTTKDMLSSSKASSNNLYLTELCRSIAEFLTDDRRAILKSAGGVMSLVDLWAVFNRARGGVELVSPSDFEAASQLFDKLTLPVRLRRFRSGLLVVQERSQTDAKTVQTLIDWLQTLKEYPPDMEVSWDWRLWGRGVTAQETAERFGWSIGVASEELEMAEERGALCRENGIEGVKFWQNYLGQAPVIDFEALAEEKKSQIIMDNLRQVGLS